jgi:hypothetical protein
LGFLAGPENIHQSRRGFAKYIIIINTLFIFQSQNGFKVEPFFRGFHLGETRENYYEKEQQVKANAMSGNVIHG